MKKPNPFHFGILSLVLGSILGVTQGVNAAPNTWNNAPAGGFIWDNSTANWLSPQVWVPGDDAIFTATGAGTITQTSPITAHSLTFSAPGYTILGTNTNSITLTGAGAYITVDSPATLSTRIAGTSGLIKNGSESLTLKGSSTFTGGTWVKNGTIVLNATGVNVNGTSYALGNIESLDAGATVKFFNDVDMSNPSVPLNVGPVNGQLFRNNKLVMTGGTFDVAGNDNINQMPAPSGTGFITNSSPYSRGVLKMGAVSGSVITFSGVISDGGTLTESIVADHTGYRLDFDMQQMTGATFILDNVNTFSGFTRIGNGTLSFTPNGTWGLPTDGPTELTRSPNGTVIVNGGINDLRVDFNGTNQTTGGINGNGGVFANNKNGTSSTLTVGAINISNTGWPTGGQTGKIVDNTNGGTGIVALTKIGTGTIGIPTAQNTYSGPTTIHNGTLEFTATGAPSPNSDIMIYGPGQLSLAFAGSFNANGFFINGVRQPDNVPVNATNYPGVVSGPGSINIVPVHPTIIPTISAARSGNNVVVTWTGSGILQVSPDLVNWTDKPGASTPWTKTAPVGKEFYRLRN